MRQKLLILVLLLAAFSSGYAFRAFFSDAAHPPKGLRKVSGLGGIFFKTKDPKALRQWYASNLGLEVNQYGSVFEWYQGADSTKKGFTQWSPFKETTTYFEPSNKDFMINYRVEDLDGLVQELKNSGVVLVDSVQRYDYGSFAHIMDPEGNKIELWQANDKVYEQMGLDMHLKTTK